VDIRRIDLSAQSLRRSQHPDRFSGRIKVILAYVFLPITLVGLWTGLVLASQRSQPSSEGLDTRALQPVDHLIFSVPVPNDLGQGSSTTTTTPPVPTPASALESSHAIEPSGGAPPFSLPSTTAETPAAIAWAALPGVICIRDRESGDNYAENTGNGYYGAYQDLLSTWQANGGTGLPSDASPAIQDQINYEIYLSGGWSQWSTASACRL
jgi:hypothetical protein